MKLLSPSAGVMIGLLLVAGCGRQPAAEARIRLSREEYLLYARAVGTWLSQGPSGLEASAHLEERGCIELYGGTTLNEALQDPTTTTTAPPEPAAAADDIGDTGDTGAAAEFCYQFQITTEENSRNQLVMSAGEVGIDDPDVQAVASEWVDYLKGGGSDPARLKELARRLASACASA